MSAPATPVSLCNRALASFGSAPITTMQDVAPPGPACALVYQNVTDELLAGYDWHFCDDMVKLTPLALTPGDDGFLDAGWRYAFALPTPRLKLPSKYMRFPRREDFPIARFEVQSERVYSDEEQLWAVVQMRADESVWPPFFCATVVACLAAELIMPISGNASLYQTLYAKAFGTPQENRRGGMVGEAMRLDAQTKGNKKIRLDAMFERWRNG